MLLDVIVKRASSRAFATTPVPGEMIETMLEAARWAPSYGNRQPWRFIVVRDPDVMAKVHEALTRGNSYAKRAPVLIALAGDPQQGQIVGGKEYYLLDSGLALENLILQAVALGLVAHPMGGFDESIVRAALGIPDFVRVLALVAVGFPGRADDLDERTRERELRPRGRKAPDEIRAYDRWVWGDERE